MDYLSCPDKKEIFSVQDFLVTVTYLILTNHYISVGGGYDEGLDLLEFLKDCYTELANCYCMAVYYYLINPGIEVQSTTKTALLKGEPMDDM